MRQHDLLTAVRDDLRAFNNHPYEVTYTPLKNVSDQPDKGPSFLITPGTMRKESVSHGTPITYQEVIIGHFQVVPDNAKTDELVIRCQNDLSDIIDHFMGRLRPVKFTDDVTGEVASCYAAESGPVQDSGVMLAPLEESPRTLIGSVSITFLIA